MKEKNPLLSLILIPFAILLFLNSVNGISVLDDLAENSGDNSITQVLNEALMENQALGFVCQGVFKPLVPTNLSNGFALTFFSTRMQEATAPMEINWHSYEGHYVTVDWQVSDGGTFWGTNITFIDQQKLIFELPVE